MGRGANESGPSFMETQQEFEEAHGSPRALETSYFRADDSAVDESAFPDTHAHLDHRPAAVRTSEIRGQVDAQVGIWWGAKDGSQIVDTVDVDLSVLRNTCLC